MKILCLLPLLTITFAQAETLQCQVTDIIDGNTFNCLTEQQQPAIIKLYQVKAPTIKQKYGQEAKRRLSGLLGEKKVTIDIHSQTREHLSGTVSYYSVSWDCELSMQERSKKDPPLSWECGTDTFNLNHDMILLGIAKFDQTTGQNPEYQQAEQQAKQAKRGLWADK